MKKALCFMLSLVLLAAALPTASVFAAKETEELEVRYYSLVSMGNKNSGGFPSSDGMVGANTTRVNDTNTSIWLAEGESYSQAGKVTVTTPGADAENGLTVTRWSITGQGANIKPSETRYIEVDYHYEPSENAPGVGSELTVAPVYMGKGWSNVGSAFNAVYTANEKIRAGSHTATFDLSEFPYSTNADGLTPGELDALSVNFITLGIFKGAVADLTADDAFYIKDLRVYNANPHAQVRDVVFASNGGEYSYTEQWTDNRAYILPDPTEHGFFDDKTFLGWRHSKNGQTYKAGEKYNFYDNMRISFEAVYSTNEIHGNERLSATSWTLTKDTGGFPSADGMTTANTTRVKDTNTSLWNKTGETYTSAAKITPTTVGTDAENGLGVVRWSISSWQPTVTAKNLRYVEVDYYYEASENAPGEGSYMDLSIGFLGTNNANIGDSYEKNGKFTSRETIKQGANTATFDLSAFPVTDNSAGINAYESTGVHINYLTLYSFRGAVADLTSGDAIYIKSLRFYNTNPNSVNNHTVQFIGDGEELFTQTWSNGYSQTMPDSNGNAFFEGRILKGWKNTDTGVIYSANSQYNFFEDRSLSFEAVYETALGNERISPTYWTINKTAGGFPASDGNTSANTTRVEDTNSSLWNKEGETYTSAAKVTPTVIGTDAAAGLGITRWSLAGWKYPVLAKDLRYIEVDYYYDASENSPGSGSPMDVYIGYIGVNGNDGQSYSSDIKYTSNETIKPGAHTATFDLSAFAKTEKTDGISAYDSPNARVNFLTLYSFRGAVSALTADDAIYIKAMRLYNTNPNSFKNRLITFKGDGDKLFTKTWTDNYTQTMPGTEESGFFENKELVAWKHSKSGVEYAPGSTYSFTDIENVTFEAVYENIIPEEIPVTITVGGTECVLDTETWTITSPVGGDVSFSSFASPRRDGYLFLGYKNSANEYVTSGDAVSKGDVLSAEFIPFDTQKDLYVNGFSVRITGIQGLRFTSSLSGEIIEELESIGNNIFYSKEKGEDAKFGALILPNNILNHNELTFESDRVAISPANKFYTNEADTAVMFNNVLIKIAQHRYTTSFTCRPYLTYTDMCGNTHNVYGEQYKSDLAGGLSLYSAAKYIVECGSETEETNDYLRENIMKKAQFGTLMNMDMNMHRRFYNYVGSSLTADNAQQKLNDFIDEHVTDDVNDYIFDVLSQLSSTPSEYIVFKGDKYNETTQGGISVDWTSNDDVYMANKLANELGIEPYSLWIDRVKNHHGKRVWLSFRMNDCHGGETETAWQRDSFFYTARENGWMVGDKYGYWATCFDYSVPEVREYFKDYIEEQLLTYDVDGVEWDFTREMICFDYQNNPECYLIMNDFMRELKNIVVKAEKKWGHPIKINVRVLRDIAQDKTYGFDVETWADEGLVTSVAACPRFVITDCDIPVSEWKEMLKGTGVELYAGLDVYNWNQRVNDASTIAGYTRKYLAEGADRMYTFNMFYLFNGGSNAHDNGFDYAAMHHAAASYENAISQDNRFVLTYQDVYPAGAVQYKPLPFAVSGSGSFELETGSYSENTKAIIYIACDSDSMELTVNGVKATKIPDTSGALVQINASNIRDTMYKLYENTALYAYEVTCDASSSSQMLGFSADDDVNISYIEWFVSANG